MVILKRIILIHLLLLTVAHAQVESVNVICPAQTKCDELSLRATNLLKNKNTRTDVEKAIEFILLDQSIDKLSYEIIQKENKNWLVKLNIIPKFKIAEIISVVSDSELDASGALAIIPLKENGFFEEDLVPESKRIINDFFVDRGYPHSTVELTTVNSSEGIVATFKIVAGKGITVSEIAIESDLKAVEHEILSEFSIFTKSTWNASEAKRISELLGQRFFERGFWAADITAQLESLATKNILIIKAKLGTQFLFTFRGLSAFSRGEVLRKIKDGAKSSNLTQIDDVISMAIEKLYDNVGLYKVNIKIRKYSSQSKKGIRRSEFYVDIIENEKTQLGSVVLEGNQFIDTPKFDEILDEECSVLACRGYYDRKFFIDFSDKLRLNYLKSGFVMANVTTPEVRENIDGKLDVKYVAIENQRIEISKIEFPGVPAKLVAKILSQIKSKQGEPLDVTVIESDMNKALEVLREEGYFFARFAQARDSEIVSYGRSFQTAQIVIPFELGKKTYFDGLLVTGNIETKSVVVERELDLQKGDLVTSKEINRLRDRLVSLGLFGNVIITPFLTQSSLADQYWLSFLVEVKERNFGLGEVAPGYRTDLGPKASFQLSYNNIQGMNRTVLFKTQTNIRLDASEFDDRRSKEAHRKLEFSGELIYREPWLFPKVIGNKWEFEFSTSFKRQRFFAFDADIFRIGPRITKQFGDHLTASVRYQFENINQFDATETKDGDRFQIGGITPSVSLDFRDNPIIPTKGAFFGVSWEFANPYFGSQSRKNLEVNFSKLTSRNRFYYPVGNLVFALSISGGVQTNFANELRKDADGNQIYGEDGVTPLTRGYIPSIKVFRLDGIDNVRGFGDDEINRLPIGLDIGELRVQDTVSFVNYKLEPRYYFSDLIAVGIFFDAGGLYVNHFSPLKVQTSMGLSAKLVTPVGSLDFDYGVKLHRRRYASGRRESFGRFHLSIGSF